MSNVKELSIYQAIKNAYEKAIPEINKAMIPDFYDGLKPSQRVVIYALMKLGGDKKFILLSEISGYVCGKLYESGTDSMDRLISALVHKGILIGKGNHGAKFLYNKDADPAAPRYIYAKLNPLFANLFNKLKDQWKLEDSPYGNPVPKQIFTPIPICCMTGSPGLGIAANTDIPAFTPKSMIEALENDNPQLLKSSFGVDIVYDESDLKKIWEVGHGKIVYKMKVTRGEFEGLKGIFIEGNPELFKPSIQKYFWRQMKENLVIVRDLGTKSFVARNYNVRKINDEFVFKYCNKAAKWEHVYMLSTNKSGTVGRAPLRYWISTILEHYDEIYKKQINKEILECKDEIKVLSVIKEVGKLLIKDKSDKEISKELFIPEWIVQECSRRSISALRNDHSSEIKKLKEKINYLASIDTKNETLKLIKTL